MNICILANRKNKPSETFIRSHIKRLEGNKSVLYAREYPYYTGVSFHSLNDLKQACKDLARILLYPVNMLQERLFSRFLDKKNIDVILAEYGLSGVKVMKVANQNSVPMVVHFHGFEAYDQYELARASEKYKRLFDIAYKTISVSKEMTGKLKQMGASDDDLVFNPYGVDTEKFKGGKPGEVGPKFVSVGRFVPKKAPKVTIEAFRKVKKKIPGAYLTMIGDGELLNECKTFANELNLSECITFTGALSHKNVVQRLKQARAFILHSVQAPSGDSEGTPVAILEACSMGLPVVSTRHAGIRDVIEDGETGFLGDEGDVENFAQSMIKLAKNPELAAELGRNARRYIQENYSIERYINKLQTVLNNALESTSSNKD